MKLFITLTHDCMLRSISVSTLLHMQSNIFLSTFLTVKRLEKLNLELSYETQSL